MGVWVSVVYVAVGRAAGTRSETERGCRTGAHLKARNPNRAGKVIGGSGIGGVDIGLEG